jgi:hypothetical protein
LPDFYHSTEKIYIGNLQTNKIHLHVIAKAGDILSIIARVLPKIVGVAAFCQPELSKKCQFPGFTPGGMEAPPFK